MNYKSQYQQDKFLNEVFFKSAKNGYFVDVGAYDGFQLSDSYVFEKELDWKGVCIEPSSVPFSNLVKNRSCICLNCCIYNEDSEIDFLEISGGPEMLSGILQDYNVKHVDRINLEISESQSIGSVVKKSTKKLETVFLENNCPNKIEYLKIDTEGSELKALQGIDFKVREFKVIQIEINYQEDLEPIDSYLKSMNYVQFHKINQDIFWTKS